MTAAKKLTPLEVAIASAPASSGHNPYWAIDPKNHQHMTEILRQSLMCSRVEWDKDKNGYKITWDHWGPNYRVNEPGKRGIYKKHPTGRTLTVADLDMELLRKRLSVTGDFKELLVPGTIETSSVYNTTTKKHEDLPTRCVICPEYIARDQLQSLYNEGDAQRGANGFSNSKSNQYRGYY